MNHLAGQSLHDDVIKWKHLRVIGPLWEESTGHRRIPSQRPVTRSFDVFFHLRLTNGRANNRGAGDLRRHYYDVIVMWVVSDFVPTNYKSALVQGMVWCPADDSQWWPTSLTHICVTWDWYTYMYIVVSGATSSHMSNFTYWGRVTHICRLAGAKPLSEPMLEYC